MAFIHDAMSQVVNGEGTARSARMNVPDVLLAGKTGTAQVRRITMAERAGGVRGDAALRFKLRDHSLFQGFAPANNPLQDRKSIVKGKRVAGRVRFVGSRSIK